ncbi:hypothetical protein ONZ45_g12328 [Pleurotus djamor]|nr:hypothetical protein ONZ45_g12328 [Pleurotus djamor]
MSRLFYVSGDASLAKRTLRLYIQVVGKAYQTLMSDSGKSVSSSRNAEETETETETALSVDVDTDRHWVETLTRGARMLCKLASVSKEAKYMDDLKEVGDIIAKARTRLPSEDHDLVAAVELAEGVWRSTLALKANDPYSRPANLALSHTHLLRSLDVFPTPAAAYHLALSFARPGPAQDLDQAIVYAGQAMETDPGELRYWHLMGLLLSGAEKWQAAMEILDSGADIGEAAEDEDATEQGIQDENSTPTVANPRNSLDAAMNGVSQRSRNGHISSESIGNGQFFHHPAYAPSASGSSRTQDIEPLPLIPSGACTLPPSDTLLAPVTDYPRPSEQDQFEFALQLRMTRAAIAEYVEGAEIAEVKWLDVFSWIAEKRGIVPRQGHWMGFPSPIPTSSHPSTPTVEIVPPAHSLPPPIPINILPATPDTPHQPFSKSNRTSSDTETADTIGTNHQGSIYENSSDHRHTHIPRLQVHKRSHSSERDSSKKSTKRVQQFVKSGVHKGQATITTISKKIGNGVVRNGPMRRSTSTPDFHAALKPSSYQASSIHSRRRISSIIQSQDSNSFIESPPPPPPPSLPNLEALKKPGGRAQKENTLLSDLWLMSAATFRRLGKIEQAKGAIQEAEVRDEDNPNVWIQLGLYYSALNHHRHAIDALQKGLFLDTDNVSASVHLCRLYLTPREGGIHLDHIDLAAGILSELTQGSGWDVPEAWYYLAKAYGLQGRKDKERECLEMALRLSEHRPIRDFVSALGCCI